MRTSSIEAPTEQTEAPVDLLLLDADGVTAQTIAGLGDRYRVNTTTDPAAALDYLRRVMPQMVVAALGGESGEALEICRAAKGLRVPATVLVTSSSTALVPDALRAGCDSVLMKPFSPNLLITRLGRLVRGRATDLRLRSAFTLKKVDHLVERANLLKKGTNQRWPDERCPYCSHQEVTSFDYASMRRAWYACLACSQVWMAKRREEFV